MRAVIIERQGVPVAANVRVVSDWPPPDAPGPGQVLIRTLCSALNHMDLWVGRGVPGLSLSYPRVSGCDACGVVERVGAGVDPAWLGRRVIVNAAVPQPARGHPDDPPERAPAYELIGEHRPGMHAEHFLAPADNLADVGQTDPVQAAAFGLVTLTAYSMLVDKAGLTPGMTVLVTGIGGGVATAAARLARWMGCPLAVTSRHPWKLDRARALFHASCLVLDTGDDFSPRIRAWTNKRGVDVAVDSIGKTTHLPCLKSLARGGVYATCGTTAGPDATTDLARVFWNQLRIVGSTMGTNEQFRRCAALLRAGVLDAVVDSVFAAGEAAAAWTRLESGEQFGKIVLRWS